jgi:glycosyltransferase involved in cell wall biosynthesis
MVVSVIMLTYKHETFLRQAIEGVLMQNINFEVELLVADDCSPDNTERLVDEISQNSPNGKLIKYIRQVENIGAQSNFISAYKNCTGKFIALCEGDDYWIDSSKLQKQIDFLNANTEYSICFHRVYELEKEQEPQLSTLNKSSKEGTFTIEDLAKGNFIHTPSVVFRKDLKELPIWFAESPAGDYPLSMLNARYGKLKYFPEPMAVYRKHAASSWSSKEENKILESWVTVLNLLLPEFEGKTLENLLLQKAKTHYALSELYAYEGMIEESKHHLYYAVKISPFYFDLFYDAQAKLINSLKQSKSYKVGNFIVKPLSKVLRIFKS